MRCALIHLENKIIENIIVADPAADTVASGYLLLAAPDYVNPGDRWNGEFEEQPAQASYSNPKPQVVDGLEML